MTVTEEDVKRDRVSVASGDALDVSILVVSGGITSVAMPSCWKGNKVQSVHIVERYYILLTSAVTQMSTTSPLRGR